MQQIFYTTVSPEEYCHLGKDFPFPKPISCPNPHCRVNVPPQKHGFYHRNTHNGSFSGRIVIRRYYCPYCRTTISYLPSFCLPYFQYTVDLIFFSLKLVLDSNFSLRGCLRLIRERFRALYWAFSHLQFYLRRFVANLNSIKMFLRQLNPRISLLEDNPAKREGAQKVLRLLVTGFSPIQIFSTRFYEAQGYSFMAPLRNILA